MYTPTLNGMFAIEINKILKKKYTKITFRTRIKKDISIIELSLTT